MTDYQLQRLNMVESQVRPSDVTDQRILRAMLEIPREKFVPPALASMAYMDEAVPARASAARGEGRFLLAPRVFAKLVNLADIGPDCALLDVGCASGYSTAVLARIARRVVGLECDEDLVQQAGRLLAEMNISNAKVVKGSLAAGVAAEGPFDAIMLNGAVPSVPKALLDQLGEGGRLVAIVAEERDSPPAGEPAVCRAQIWRRSRGVFDSRPAFDAWGPPLPGFAVPAGFVF